MNALTEKLSSKSVAKIATNGTSELGQFLTFVLGGEVFALEISNIKEIIQYGEPTEVPMMPSFIRGVINLRGKVVPVVDLSARFSRGATAVARRTSIIVIEMQDESETEDGAMANDGQHIGVMVDAVNEVVEIAASDIEPPPSYGARIRPDFISGMAKRDGKFIVVLNLSQVLSIEEMAAFGQATVQTGIQLAEKEGNA
jgi:purine-binding chemotaxis protein CheW